MKTLRLQCLQPLFQLLPLAPFIPEGGIFCLRQSIGRLGRRHRLGRGFLLLNARWFLGNELAVGSARTLYRFKRLCGFRLFLDLLGNRFRLGFRLSVQNISDLIVHLSLVNARKVGGT
jgi:hypothetical protein